jgi:poly(beta-D-mannuronate) lyase
LNISRNLPAALLLISPASVSQAYADGCPAVPPPVVDLNLERFYEDSAGSIVEPTRMEDHKVQTAPLVEFVGFITKEADRSWKQRSNPTATVACALQWISGWARGGAYLGKMGSKQSEAQRKWDLAGTALGYLKLRRNASAEDRALIEPWLSKWADATRAAFDDAGIKRNNHWYWLGLAEAAVALATDDTKRWQAAKDIFTDATKDISADGTLPLELAREGRALYYHVFALEPLVLMAEIAAARGEDWYAINNGAVHRLVARTVEGIADPAVFDKLAGITQQRPIKVGVAWAKLYRARFPGTMSADIEQPINHRWLGGDVSVLFQALRQTQ